MKGRSETNEGQEKSRVKGTKGTCEIQWKDVRKGRIEMKGKRET